MAEHKSMEAVHHVLGGKKKDDKPAKEIKEIRIRKVKTEGGHGHVIEHHHTRPEHHPMEEHMTKNDDELADHVLSNMGTPNPGEAEADAGQSGIPEGAAAPEAGASAGAPAPDASAGAPAAIPGA